jgi:hypothetical protein
MKQTLIVLAICGWCCTHLSAGIIGVANSSFESEVLASGAGTTDAITDWIGSSTANVQYGVYNPAAVSYTGGAPDGSNVAYLLEDGPSISISQILTTDLQANDIYTFSVDIGLRSDTNVFVPGLGCYGYDAALEAGGVVLNSLSAINKNNCNLLTNGQFTTLSFTFNSGASPATLGDPLEIVLTAGASGSFSEPAEIDFDAVSLSDTASVTSTAPEPATFGIMAAAVGMFFMRRLRRNRPLA